jgi:ribonucleotide reductase beta subunit family protein with ferritin-like domain
MTIDGMTVFNNSQVNLKEQPMFFGQPLGIQQYLDYKYPIFEKLTETQLGFFWRPNEVSLQKDRSDYQTLRPEQKHIFTSNLKYQVMLDSVQGRATALAFLPYCSLPELESCIEVWGFMEMIHSRSYTHIIKNLYSQPEEVFDTILDDERIMARAKSVTESYDDFINTAHHYDNGNGWKFANEGVPSGQLERYEVKRKLFRAMMNVNILEGLRFYVSFACSFAFAENKVMEGSAKILSLIARDENQHLVITQNIINNWRKGDDPEMKRIYEEEIGHSEAMFLAAEDEEKAWAKYLFKDGSMIGLSEKLLNNYVEWLSNTRRKAIGLKPIYDVAANSNPLPWMDHWLKSKSVQNAPQETEIESYVIGGIAQDIKKNAFSGFKL